MFNPIQSRNGSIITHATELDIPIPRPVRLRIENPLPDTHFDPWMTWRTSWKCFVAAMLSGAIGGLLTRWEWFFAIAPLVFSALLGAFGLMGIVSGLLQANEEIRGHRFLVERGVAVCARVVGLRYEDNQEKYLVYQFTDERGRKRKYSCRSVGRADALRALVVGDEFDLLYEPRNSRHFVPYEAAIYEVAK